MIQIIILLSIFVNNALCTTEWFGDLRAHLNPPQAPPFYDVVYDESECPFGLESIAIPEYVYFGEMIGTKSVREHSACLEFCLETPRCKAINYFESLGKKDQELGFCELLVETQYDNPRLMRPFRKATYYEKIRCRTTNEEDDQPFEFDTNGKEGKELLLAGGGMAQAKEKTKEEEAANRKREENSKGTGKQEDGMEAKKQTEEGDKGAQTRRPPTDLTNSRWNIEKETALKKLAQKVHEFNLRFKS